MEDVVETFNSIRIVYDGFNKNKKLTEVRYPKDFIIQYEVFLSPFFNYDRKFLIFLSLISIVLYGENNFIEFLKKMNYLKKNREIYYKFKHILQSPNKFVKKDIHFILENVTYITKEDVFRLYQTKQISFYTFYFLSKRYEDNMTLVEKMIYKRVAYLFKFIKYNIDESIFNVVINKEQTKNLF